MSTAWRPDDSPLAVDKKGQIKGAQKTRAAQRKFKISGGKVMTSKDRGVNAARRSLRRPGSPPGVSSWQLPIVPGGNSLIFYSELKPGAKVPRHKHDCDVFRVVFKGSLKYGRKVLGPGDWMHVPAGEDYSVEAGPEGCIVWYTHW
jgi:quercetin dioxygenase-like cupin family protein